MKNMNNKQRIDDLLLQCSSGSGQAAKMRTYLMNFQYLPPPNNWVWAVKIGDHCTTVLDPQNWPVLVLHGSLFARLT